MTNLDLTFLGADSERLMNDSPSVVRQITRYFEHQNRTGTSIRVYTYPRTLVDTRLEWVAIISSPTGRHTVTIKQCRSGDPVIFTDSRHENKNQLPPASSQQPRPEKDAWQRWHEFQATCS